MSDDWVPLTFHLSRAILRWHDDGRPWRAEDLRVDTFFPGTGTQPVSVLHLPTGGHVEGIGNRDEAVEALRASLCDAADHLARVRAASRN